MYQRCVLCLFFNDRNNVFHTRDFTAKNGPIKTLNYHYFRPTVDEAHLWNLDKK